MSALKCLGRGYVVEGSGFVCAKCGTSIYFGDMHAEIIGDEANGVARVAKELVRSRGSSKDKISINISGGQIGTLNLGTMVGRIKNNLRAVSESETVKLAHAIEQLIETIFVSD